MVRHSLALLWSMLKVGSIGFGGGAALIPVVEREVVQRRKLLTTGEFATHTLIANLTPGALPVKLGALAGAQTSSPSVALLSGCAVALPGAVATVALMAGFTVIGESGIRVVESAAVGITAFIIVLLGHFIVKVIRASEGRRRAMVAITALAFLASGGSTLVGVVGRLLGQSWSVVLPQLSAVQLIVAALAAIGAGHLMRRHASTPAQQPASSRGPWIACAVFVAVVIVVLAVSALWPRGLEFLGLTALSTVTSFGGGEAYVAVADGFFVRSGMVSGSSFYGQTVPIANALPGPILVKIASALGFSFGLAEGGWPLAAVFTAGAFLLSVAASCAPAMALMGGYTRVANSLFVRRLGTYILPVICGLLLTTSLSMIDANMEIAARVQVSPAAVGWATLAAVATLWVLRERARLHDLWLLVIGGGCSTVALLMSAPPL